MPVGQVQEDREPGGAFTRVPIALRLPAPQIRSPSQWPGTARPATSAGRSPAMAMGSRNLGRLDWPSPRCLRAACPRRMACLGWGRGSPLPCMWMDWWMVSWHAFMLSLSGWPRRGLPLICSGLRCLSGPALISSHSRVPGMILRGLGRLGRWVAICWARCGPYAPPMSSALRRSSRLMVLGALPRVRAMARTPLPARRMSAMAMRSSMHRYLASICLGLSMPPRYQSTSGRSLRPVERVLPLRQAFPVRLDTPTAWAAWVKFMPPRRRRCRKPWG